MKENRTLLDCTHHGHCYVQYLCYKAILSGNCSCGDPQEVISEDSIAHGVIPPRAEKALQLHVSVCVCVCVCVCCSCMIAELGGVVRSILSMAR